ncbi:ABC transporter permease [Anaerobacillus isosaccharinicus]|uniref:Glycine/betaine ABC transporter n=1 Tax=Anaerobacillus isosaccharinicus TaxID=1532552 RepID=A0A1S2MGK4_9BACI|nr:proline/glycine betaine ABC transporter permease [Anaerobacillus isosaccharinicus]MBA5588858.1 proline/glycine betaine ABC transporter permease [Anaerobacillus isosaccharinicus]QOY37754.1 proline/glycine betaine ABC transporter permease [Anaerobacillus isosaccharinicus]
MNLLPKLPLADGIDTFVDWLKNAEGLFTGITAVIRFIVNQLSSGLSAIPELVFILLITALAFFATKKKIGLPIFTFFGLLLIQNLGYWNDMLLTLSLVLTSAGVSVIFGVPIGIWMAKSRTTENVITPILDFMQTMPAFVYLIPAVVFFGIGMVPGVIASVIFAMPPTVRLTNLGIRQVSTELIEAADAFGSTPFQKLYKVQIPMAKKTIMAGVNQSIMLALSMVVIASMIGASGLGTKVYYAVGRNDAGGGFEAGIALVIVAIILDRLTQSFNKQKGIV